MESQATMTTGGKNVESRDGANIELRSGNLFDSGAHTIVITVNCVGVMGKGLARVFKEKFPEVFREYQRACRAGEVAPGRVQVVETRAANGPKYVVNFPTKRHWRDASRIDGCSSWWGLYFRTGNASKQFVQIDRYVVDRLRTLRRKRKGRNLKPGEMETWTREAFEDLGLCRLRGTIRFPERPFWQNTEGHA